MSARASFLENVDPQAFLADKAYDADRVALSLEQRGDQARHPAQDQSKCPTQLRFRALSRANLVERFFNTLKHFRVIATRYDKLARNFLAALHLVGAIILLN